MRVAMYYKNKDVRLEEMPVPKIGPGEILMKVTSSGLCGSDVMEWYRAKKSPLVLGHEVAGEVVEVGDGVTRLKSGDRIAAAHHVPCNTCYYCLNNHHTACDTLRSTSFDPGGFSEYLRLPAINVDRGTFIVPDNVSDDDATFHEPIGCVLRALRIASLKPGQSVLVLGGGISGLLTVLLARSQGAGRILVVEPNEYRRIAAEKFGADLAVVPSESVKQRFADLNNGRLADLVMVCTGAEAAQNLALQSVERGGAVLFFALTGPGVTIPVSINDFFSRNDVTLTTSYGAAPLDSSLALEMLTTGILSIGDMITHRLPLAQTQRGFELTEKAQESIKVIIHPHN
ncbi:alcohol dehydrogenase catalytic domain-containing protein [Acidobacteriota bacterium]